MTPFNCIFYFNICHVTVCNILPFPSWQIFNLVFHRQVIKSRVLSVKKLVFNIESIKINAGCLTVSNIFTPLSLQSSILAYAAHCQTDSEGRPLAGTMVICRETLSMEKYTHEHFVQVTVSVFEKSELLKNRNIQIAFALCYFVLVQTVIHELFHVLGFSQELFSRWKDCSLSSQGR